MNSQDNLKTRNFLKIQCFEELHFISRGLEASPEDWKSPMAKKLSTVNFIIFLGHAMPIDR
jgi:hypothetical protein